MKKTKSGFGGIRIGFDLLGWSRFLLLGGLFVFMLAGCPSSIDEMGDMLQNGGGGIQSAARSVSITAAAPKGR
jgi:hypothetical protein